jgi:rRNA 2''-O-methyltransferase fibrillarin (EC 2.1.1.-)
MQIETIFDGVYKLDGKLCTESLVQGKKVYGEEHKEFGGKEYRMWNPYRSKLAAAILNGLKNEHIRRSDSVLYLGAATGTTTSHVSDMIGKEGLLYCVELSERNMRDLLTVCESRTNMLPILADARYTERYELMLKQCDIIYQDVSSPEQVGILLSNSRFLKKGGYAYFAIKSQSIDIKKSPEHTFRKALAELSRVFEVVEEVRIEPYHKLHLFAVLRKI